MGSEEDHASEGDHSNRGSRGSHGSHGSHGSGSVADDSVELNAIEPMEDDKETKQKEDKDKTSENEAEPSETQPLKQTDAANNDIAKDKDLEAADSDEEGAGSNGAGSRRPYKRQWDVKCIVIGISTLLLIVGGAVIAILVHKFTGKEPYEFQFSSLYGDHMVLQRAPGRAVVWGHGPISSENATVWLTVAGEGIQQTREGRLHNRVWRVLLDPISAHGPFTITAQLEGFNDHSIILQDVLFGDVWLCAGEDNMQFSVGQLEMAQEQLTTAENYPSIRLLSMASRTANYPLHEQRGIELLWTNPTAESLARKVISDKQFAPDFSALCWLYGKQLQDKLHYPIGLVSATYSNSSITQWVAPSVLDHCGISATQKSSNVWNGVINPVLTMAIYGSIWYQGETDATGVSRSYNCSFASMINHWRHHAFQATGGATDPNFPLGFVQLAPNRDDPKLTYGFTDTRWQQTANYGFVPNPHMNNTFMAVATDLPDVESPYGSIHPRDKVTIAERLVQGALSVAYRQRGVVFSGPFPVKYMARPSDRSLVLTLDSTLVDIRNETGFEVCCSEDRGKYCPSSYIKTSYAPGREWVAAPITTSSGSTVTLSWEQCEEDTHAVAVRYSWRETPCAYKKCGVYDGTSGLPMAPYIKIGLVDDGAEYDLPLEQSNFI